jgi:hypothetical protein
VQLEQGDMWSIFDITDVFMITTNPIRRKDGAVVMGRGIALEAKTRFPQLPYEFGRSLDEYSGLNIGFIAEYGDTFIWYFMVKDHWREEAKLKIIEQSVGELCDYISDADCGYLRFDLNFPGIGNGKLSRADVLPLLVKLPDNVHIWEKT